MLRVTAAHSEQHIMLRLLNTFQRGGGEMKPASARHTAHLCMWMEISRITAILSVYGVSPCMRIPVSFCVCEGSDFGICK